MNITSNVELVTPEKARDWLKTSIGNRKLRMDHCKSLSNAIRRGEWLVTHQGIAFDSSGALRDGHHRLTAICIADIAVQIMVTRGLDAVATDAMDQGARRQTADILSIDKRIAEPLKLGAVLAFATPRPTIPQVRQIANGGLFDAVADLVGFCGATRRFYSSAPMKLAASIQVMNGERAEFVYEQYRSLCALDFDSMTVSAKSLVRQVDSKHANAINSRETVARGLRVFEEGRRDITRIQVSEADIESAQAFVRFVLRKSIGAA